MHSEIEFTVEPKNEVGTGPARRLRAKGKIPAVVYGPEMEPVKVSFREQDLAKALATPAARNVFLRLKSTDERVDGARVMVKDLQIHPVKRQFTHADFYKLHPERPIQARVQIRLDGTAVGVKLGGVMQVARRDLRVSCLPDDLPDAIAVDVTAMRPGDSVHVGDLAAPKGVTILSSPKLAVCAVIAPSGLEEEAAEAGAEEGGEEAAEGGAED